MPLTVLTDADVNAVLFALTREDVIQLHRSLAEALHSYSVATTTEQSGCCSVNQPERISVHGKDGSTTLFMPSVSDSAKGVKIVTIGETTSSTSTAATGLSPSPIATDFRSLSLSDNQRSKSTASSSPYKSPSVSTSPSASRISFVEPSSPRGSPSRNSNKSIYRSSRTSKDTQSQEPQLAAPAISTSPKGSLTLLDERGNPRALVNASTLTGFRTALASTLLLRARDSVHTVTCFGAGVQAFWHIYLSFLLRGSEIHHLNIINRSFDHARELALALGSCLNPTVQAAFRSEKVRTDLLTPTFGEYNRLLKEHVRAADVIFMTTPSTEPLFPASFLTSPGAHTKGRYIAAIGSYKPHMREIPVEVIHQAVRGQHKHHGLHHKYAESGSAIVVDTIDGVFKEAGEVIESGISGDNVIEIGEIVMLIKSSNNREEVLNRWDNTEGRDTSRKTDRKSSSRSSSKEKESGDTDKGLTNWMERGNVVYKSVGLGLMDVVVGMELVRLAEERGVGITIHDF